MIQLDFRRKYFTTTIALKGDVCIAVFNTWNIVWIWCQRCSRKFSASIIPDILSIRCASGAPCKAQFEMPRYQSHGKKFRAGVNKSLRLGSDIGYLIFIGIQDYLISTGQSEDSRATSSCIAACEVGIFVF